MSHFWQKRRAAINKVPLYFSALSIFSKVSQLWKNYRLPIGRRKTEKNAQNYLYCSELFIAVKTTRYF